MNFKKNARKKFRELLRLKQLRKKARGRIKENSTQQLLQHGDLREGDSFRHCDDYISDEKAPLCLRKFLRYCRWPAIYQIRAMGLGINKPPLFANYLGERVRVVMASRMGDVGITRDLTVECGYSDRVPVEFLSDFSNER